VLILRYFVLPAAKTPKLPRRHFSRIAAESLGILSVRLQIPDLVMTDNPAAHRGNGP
jgi:hypothetical protein